MHRPGFDQAWARFREVNLSVAQVGAKIGGKVGSNVAGRVFENACPIRMSYVLNYTGVFTPSAGYAVSSGADHKWYMFRVNDIMAFLEHSFGKPDRTASTPAASAFRSLKGILVVKGHGWSNAQGHVTLWDGASCSDHCHFAADPDNGSFTPDTASLWVLR